MTGDPHAIIASLHVYPVKSCGGIELARATLTDAGLAHDREWMVVTSEGRFVTQREVPRMALIRTALSADSLLLEAPGVGRLVLPLAWQPARRREVLVWRDRLSAFDAGPEAATWLSSFLGRPLQLVRFDPAQRRLSSLERTGGIEAPNRFSDGYPLLLISLASLADLNSRLPQPLPMNRFRPNLVLDGVAAYAEDAIHELGDAAVRLRVVKPCTRCVITTTDQDSGVPQGMEPLHTLRGYRQDRALKGVTFGQNTIVLGGESLRAGQKLSLRMR